MKAPLALAASLAAIGCASTETGETNNPVDWARENAARAAAYAAATANPQLGPISNPSPLAQGAAEMPAPGQIAASAGGANSLWRAGSRTFFNDQRARRVGDILTVRIEIDDSAEVSNSTNRSRSSSTSVGIPRAFGLETEIGRLTPGPFDPSNLVEAEADSQARGQGDIQRNEEITLTVAAVVTEVLPNGNFVIAGRQQVRVNSEIRDLTVAGVIRPEDIAADNTIAHSQIAEARILYGGRGTISAVQKPRWGQRLADFLSPW